MPRCRPSAIGTSWISIRRAKRCITSPPEIFHAGLIGAGIAASRSPAMHMNEARALGLDLVYDLFDLDRIETGAAALPALLADLRNRHYLGVNITHPVKQAVLELLDSITEDARALGACNTVVFHDGRAIGHNTDWIGFAQNMGRGLPEASLDHVVQLGAGGAGSAVTYALIQMGARHITIHEHDADRAEGFVRRFQALAGGTVSLSRDLDKELGAATGLVNCTPVGMHKYPGIPISPELLRPALWVADIVYVPLQTQLLRCASAKGCRILGGGGMAVFQAAEALHLFTGRAPDPD